MSSESEIKKQRLKAKLRVHEQNETLLLHWLPYMHELRRIGIRFTLNYLVYCDSTEIEWWLDVISKEPWRDFNIQPSTVRTTGEELHATLYEKLPSSLPLRYRPDLPLLQSSGETLTRANLQTVTSHFSGKETILLHPRFSPVITLENIGEQLDKLPLIPLEDAVLFTPSFETILFRSLEDEWLFAHP